MKNRFLLFAVISVVMFSCGTPDPVIEPDFAQWRGLNRDGKYPDTNLLQEWPEEGPAMLWSFDSIGNGYGSPIITKDRLFIAGEEDSVAYLFAFDLQGKLLWKKEYGNEWKGHYIGCRTTPTLVDDLLYVCSGVGDIACLKKTDGTKVWSKHLVKDLNGRIPFFGYAQSLLIHDSLVFAAPGGVDTNFVALNRFTGDLVWKSAGKGENTAYNSPMMVKLKNRNVIVTFTQHQFLGYDAANGDVLWSEPQEAKYPNHANTVLFEDGYLYVAVSCGNGMFKYKLADDGSGVEQLWGHDSLMFNYFGGIIKLGDKLYGACEDSEKWKTLDANTGALIDSLDFNTGSSIYADGMLYCYNFKGKVGLVYPGQDSMQLVSSFKITKGTREHFSHPVITNGVLYIRHGASIMAFDIAEKPEPEV